MTITVTPELRAELLECMEAATAYDLDYHPPTLFDSATLGEDAIQIETHPMSGDVSAIYVHDGEAWFEVPVPA